ncbi:tRNA uridine(34) 5-carboxymethylaminomethyl modification radical SAM/GNAT enzyme Elp3 [Patescibacteria group bacterium]|nr:tRNA uridine(34) 5-carboxymethylaminomethyl modification radical SAM/GNAT enzyme Elp3 [Patescibacteria group bacterium]
MEYDTSLLQSLLKEASKTSPKSRQALETLKHKFARKHGTNLPRNSSLLKVYRKLVLLRKLPVNKRIETLLQLKTTRTLSGVTPVAIFTKPYFCPGECIYCPTAPEVPKSYLPDEPAVMRAELNNYDPKAQILSRLKQYQNIGHSTEKIDLIIKGGTWSAYPPNYQRSFITNCYQACNASPQQIIGIIPKTGMIPIISLAKAQKINETAKHRIIGINIETRPDLINGEEIQRLRNFGVTRVEIGVQSIYDDVLELIDRGHTVSDTVKATKLLKDAGFKVGYHMMPGLPGSSAKRDLEMFRIIFSDPRFQPDMLKIYPCIITSNTKLAEWYKQGKYKPYTNTELINLLVEIKRGLPTYVRVDRLGRDIPAPNIVAGCKKSNIRQIVQEEMRRRGLQCKCIRCQEIRDQEIQRQDINLNIEKYDASEGTEFFIYISAISMAKPLRKLLALLRLRFTSDNRAIIRELHTYGESIPLKQKGESAQHKGLGKRLMKEAERICIKEGFKKLFVISGIGAREYYRKLGYKLEGTYMVKLL